MVKSFEVVDLFAVLINIWIKSKAEKIIYDYNIVLSRPTEKIRKLTQGGASNLLNSIMSCRLRSEAFKLLAIAGCISLTSNEVRAFCRNLAWNVNKLLLIQTFCFNSG